VWFEEETKAAQHKIEELIRKRLGGRYLAYAIVAIVVVSAGSFLSEPALNLISRVNSLLNYGTNKRAIEQAGRGEFHAKLFAQCDLANQPITFTADGKIHNIQLNPIPAPYGIGVSTYTGAPGATVTLSNPGDPILTIYKCEFINYSTEPLFKVSVAFHIKFFETLADGDAISSFHSGTITLDREGIIEIPKIDIGNETPFILYMWNMMSQIVTVTLPRSASLSDGKLVTLIQPQSWGMHFPPNQKIVSKN